MSPEAPTNARSVASCKHADATKAACVTVTDVLPTATVPERCSAELAVNTTVTVPSPVPASPEATCRNDAEAAAVQVQPLSARTGNVSEPESAPTSFTVCSLGTDAQTGPAGV